MPGPAHKTIIAGTTFGEWTILREDVHIPGPKGLDHRYLARCSCGTERAVSAHSLRLGRSQSCGCKREEARLAKLTKHGQHRSKVYHVWEAMLNRCRNPTCEEYHNYGGRGITVCPEWLRFEAFFRDMGERPANMSLDRIDNSRGYEPGNCRWADPKTQARNRRDNRLVTFGGQTMCATDAALSLGIKPYTIWNRAQRKSESIQQAVDHYAAKRATSTSADAAGFHRPALK